MKGSLSTDWQRGIAVALAIPATAFAVSLLPLSGAATALAVRATVFAVAASILLRAVRGRRWAGASVSTAGQALVCIALIGLASLDTTSGVALSLLVASTEEYVFRYRAMDFVTAGSFDRRHLFVASVATQCAFATSHFVSGALPWSTASWLAFAGVGGCLGVIRYRVGLGLAIVLHFAVNELSRTGAMGAFIRPELPTLAFIAIAAPGLCALSAPKSNWLPLRADAPPTYDVVPPGIALF